MKARTHPPAAEVMRPRQPPSALSSAEAREREDAPRREMLKAARRAATGGEKDDGELAERLEAFVGSYRPSSEVGMLDFEVRKSLYRIGAFSFCLDLARDDERHLRASSTPALLWAAMIIIDCVAVKNTENPAEYELLITPANLGLIEYACARLREMLDAVRTGSREVSGILVQLTLRCLTRMAEVDALVPLFIENNFILVAEALLLDFGSLEDTVLCVLSNLTQSTRSHEAIRSSRISKVLRSIYDRDGENADVFTRFCAGEIIARVFGKDEEGFGQEFVETSDFLDFVLRVLDDVVEVGPGAESKVGQGIYDASELMLDVLSLATSDANKPRFASGIAKIQNAIIRRGDKNARMLAYAVEVLFQLSFDRDCLRAMDPTSLVPILKSILVETKYGEHLKLTASNLLAVIAPSEAGTSSTTPKRNSLFVASTSQALARSAGPSSKTGLLRAIVKSAVSKRSLVSSSGVSSSTGSSRRFVATTTESSTTVTATSTTGAAESVAKSRHVMISYNQKASREAADWLDASLRRNGVPVWLDTRNMGSNLNDSMAEAVENAFCLIVLVTRNYKESGNCRREMEMADNLGVPLVYLMNEPGYVGSGWLALMIGKSLWFDATTQQALEQSFSHVLKRVEEHRSVYEKQNNNNKTGGALTTPVVISGSHTVASPSSNGTREDQLSSPSSPAPVSNAEMMSLIRDMARDLKEVKEKLKG